MLCLEKAGDSPSAHLHRGMALGRPQEALPEYENSVCESWEQTAVAREHYQRLSRYGKSQGPERKPWDAQPLPSDRGLSP